MDRLHGRHRHPHPRLARPNTIFGGYNAGPPGERTAAGLQERHLASRALGLSLRPVLMETYVDPRRHQCICCRATNWRCVGDTQARGAMGGVPVKTPKMVFLYPLQRDWQAVLLGKPRPARSPRPSPAA